MFHSLVKTKTEGFKKHGIADSMSQQDVDDFYQHLQPELKKILAQFFPGLPLAQAEFDLLDELAKAIILYKLPSSLSSGLVFAGYGDDELFPSLLSIEMDGSVCGKLKYWQNESFDVDRTENRGRVFAFAQQDVVDSFLYGGDYRFEMAIIKYFSKIGKAIVDAIGSEAKFRKPTKDKLGRIIKDQFASSIQRYWDNVSPDIRHGFYRDVEDMVKAMPKQELIEFAEALVSITKLKRRVSREDEDVGGPIDVAIISKHEGFIWVKRKHYFHRDMNPRYYWRQFGDGRAASQVEKVKSGERSDGPEIGEATSGEEEEPDARARQGANGKPRVSPQ